MDMKLDAKPAVPAAPVWALLIAALAASFAHNFAEMWVRWFPAWSDAGASLYDRVTGGESYYTHAPLVPIISLMIALLVIRHTSIPVRPRPLLGGAVSGVFIFIHLFGCLARVNFVSGFAMIGLLAGLILMLWGWVALRRLWFALFLLAFMVPLPEVSIAQLNFRLKLMAADMGVRGANLLGIIVERPGDANTVKIWHEAGIKTLVIANVCNGLRTLISLIAFGALYAYVCRLSGWWRIALFALSIPIAVIANAVRIVSLIVVADIWDAKVATGWYHDTSGILVFVLAFLLMFGLEKLVLSVRKWIGRPAKILPLFHGALRSEQDEGQWQRLVNVARRPVAWTAVGLAVLTAGGSWWLNRVVPYVSPVGQLKQAVPETLEFDHATWSSVELTMDEQTLTILEWPDYFYRSYTREDQPKTDLCVIFSRDNRKGTHPPDLCIQGGGSDIVHAATVQLNGVPGRPDLPCRELVAQGGGHATYFLYTYKCGQKYTESFWSQQLGIFLNGLLNRNASGALIRVSTPIPPQDVREGRQKARERAMGLMAVAIPHLDRTLP
ncbi:MAG: Transmembrane exosortase (Exosortase_EpsH) [Planctomycetes bacterium ADurb.Bin126]|nr:MAG: Transmembrane exosortase (Exosortase_EpsH) [Planctomycetes bacterium ADurb.Bin126]